jgi:hypothetical protein
MIRVIEAAQLIERIDDPELYQKMSEFVDDVRDVLLSVDAILGNPVAWSEITPKTQQKIRALLSIGRGVPICKFCTKESESLIAGVPMCKTHHEIVRNIFERLLKEGLT